MHRLKFPNDLTDDVVHLVRLHLRCHTSEAWTDSAVRRYIRDAGPLLEDLNLLQRADVTTKSKAKADKLARKMDELEARVAEIQEIEGREVIKPPLNGKQIMDILDIPPGSKLVGEALTYLLDLRLEVGPMDEEAATDLLRGWYVRSTQSEVGCPHRGDFFALHPYRLRAPDPCAGSSLLGMALADAVDRCVALSGAYATEDHRVLGHGADSGVDPISCSFPASTRAKVER